MGAQKRIEPLLVGAQHLEALGQVRLGEAKRLLAQVLLGHGEGPREQRQGLGEAMLGQMAHGEVVEHFGTAGMVLAQGRFPKGERPLQELLGTSV